jgi:acyl-coenzyme A synthetase/AMP-(fatty) acid ligase
MPIETLLTPEYIERCTAAGFWQNRLITEYLDAAVQRHPDNEVIVDRWARLTFGQLAAQAQRRALGRRERGRGPEDIVVLQLPNWHQFAVCHIALTRIGAITSNVPHIFRHREMSYILGFTEAKAVVIPATFRNFDYWAMIRELRPQLPNLKHVFVVGGEAPAGTISYEQFLATSWERRRDPATLAGLLPAPNAVTQIAFTSGTTGEPKGVMHTSNTLDSEIATLNRAYHMTADDVIFMASPVGHHTGFLLAVRQPITLGCKAVYQELWVPAEGIAAMGEQIRNERPALDLVGLRAHC